MIKQDFAIVALAIVLAGTGYYAYTEHQQVSNLQDKLSLAQDDLKKAKDENMTLELKMFSLKKESQSNNDNNANYAVVPDDDSPTPTFDSSSASNDDVLDAINDLKDQMEQEKFDREMDDIMNNKQGTMDRLNDFLDKQEFK